MSPMEGSPRHQEPQRVKGTRFLPAMRLDLWEYPRSAAGGQKPQQSHSQLTAKEGLPGSR